VGFNIFRENIRNQKAYVNEAIKKENDPEKDQSGL